jgi:nitrate reductase gamma subunit
MRDGLLFAAVPYLVALTFLPVCVARHVFRRRRTDGAAPAPSARRGLSFIDAVWPRALGVIALGHVVAIASPDSVLLWNRDLVRLISLEVIGIVAGCFAIAGALATILRRLRSTDSAKPLSTLDVVAGTLVLVGLISGVGTAILYRWGSSWSVVTLAPYLYSLARLEPTTTLVTHLPLLVKLHVVCAFAIVAVFPFTETASLLLAWLETVTHRTLAPAVGLARAARGALAARIAVWTPALRARFLRNSAEEN